MAIKNFDVGDPVELSVIFKDKNGDVIDPDTVVLKIKYPVAGTESYTLAGMQIQNDPEEDGRFFMDIVTSEEGDHRWRWEGSGNVYAVSEGVFHVRDSKFV